MGTIRKLGYKVEALLFYSQPDRELVAPLADLDWRLWQLPKLQSNQEVVSLLREVEFVLRNKFQIGSTNSTEERWIIFTKLANVIRGLGIARIVGGNDFPDWAELAYQSFAAMHESLKEQLGLPETNR